MLKISKLRCEYFENPIGIGEKNPEFSWVLESDENAVLQTSYRLQLSKTENDFTQLFWDSQKMDSDYSVHVPYTGPVLASETRYYYRVKLTDNRNNESPWSDTQFFETGILDHSEWKASFISAEGNENPAFTSAAPLLRKEFSIGKKVSSARIYSTALGLYEIRLNGERVGEDLLTPGWTSYGKRLQYQTYDVSSLIMDGDNVLGAMLGNGWYKGYLAWDEGKNKNKYGLRAALLLQLHIIFDDGSEKLVTSDSSWKTFKGPILMSEIYHGETYDARLEPSGWDKPGFGAVDWAPVHIVPIDKSILTAQENVPVRRMNTLTPIAMIKTPSGETVIDMGQNMVGWVRFTVRGSQGDQVVLKHAEVLDGDGNFYTDNLRTAGQTIEYILKGEGEEVFEPHFTFQGFRYVKIEEWPGVPDISNFSGIVIHSAMEQTGDFKCSNDMVNQLQHNILWGQKGNFVDIPTDCPQRDERLGWTGDAQVFIRTACFNMNTAPFFKKWLRDLKADQLENGGVPFIIPHILDEKAHSSSGWGDAATVCPWTVYQCYGDLELLKEQYNSMKAWVEYIHAHAEGGLLWNSGFHFGDWLALDAKEGSYLGSTPNDLVATAFYAYSVSLLVKSAKALYISADAEHYAELHKNIVLKFREEFFTPTGRLAAHTQTAHVLALMFDLVDEKYRKRTADTLVRYLEENKWHLTTGFLGTPYLCHVLSKNGHTDIAYKLLLQTDYPSWLYQVSRGATTIWEHWDGLKPDNTFWSPDMNSFNHYAYGAIGDWLYSSVAGINIDENRPGYKHIIIDPKPGKEFDWVQAEYNSLYGTIKVKWQLCNDRIQLHIQIPHNTTASVMTPVLKVDEISGDTKDILSHRLDQNGLVLELGSGSYSFNYDFS